VGKDTHSVSERALDSAFTAFTRRLGKLEAHKQWHLLFFFQCRDQM
jgi:hypothetical protein